MKVVKILSCNDSAKWYADLIGECVPYTGTVHAAFGKYEYRSRQPDGYINFVSCEDAELIDAGKDRFDLEQDIMKAWNVVDDINLVYAYTDKFDFTAMGKENMEVLNEIQNQLLGLKSLYELKFNCLWDTFESVVHDENI